MTQFIALGPAANTYLGIAFLVLGLASTLLMYHLWGYPYDKEKHVSSAPRWMMNLHRLMGYMYLVIYLILMWQMVPRLWTYQIELPARTVVHLTCGIAIGAILILKISIVTMFRHLEGTLVPALGTMLMLCTFLVICLSVPFALRESYLRARSLPDSMEGADALLRVNRLLEEAGQTDEGLRSSLASLEGLNSGRKVLYSSCTECHDLRTVLARQRTPKNWRSTVKRMAGMSNLLNPIDELEQWQVTAYLIALTPDLQQAASQSTSRPAKNFDQSKNPVAGEQNQPATVFVKPSDYVVGQAEEMFVEKCTQCHKLSKVENYDFTDGDSVKEIVERMVVDEELELEPQEKATILYYMSQQYLANSSPAKPVSTKSEPEVPDSSDEETGTVDEPADSQPTELPKQLAIAAPKNYSSTIGKFLYENKCTECHTLDRVEKYDFQKYADAVELVDRMVDDEGMQANDKEIDFLKYYLHENFSQR